jgi:hypothetical protein
MKHKPDQLFHIQERNAIVAPSHPPSKSRIVDILADPTPSEPALADNQRK